MTTRPEGNRRRQRGGRDDSYYVALRKLRNLILRGIAVAFVPLALVAALAVRNTVTLKSEELSNRDTLRAAGWRGCARDNNERAEQQVNGRQTAKLPGIRRLFSADEIAAALRRKRERLPLLNCDPNLCGGNPTTLNAVQYELYLTRFEQGRIPALPGTPAKPWRCVGTPAQLRAPASARR